MPLNQLIQNQSIHSFDKKPLQNTIARKLSAIGLLLIIVNGTVGSGWLFTPFYAAKIAGPYAIIAWIIGGIMTLVIGLTFTASSIRLPLAGGTTELAEYTHQGLPAFLISWIAWLASVIMPAIEVQAVLQYASIYFPWLTTLIHGNQMLSSYGFACAMLLLIILMTLNILSLKNILRCNLFILSFKLLVIGLTIAGLSATQFSLNNFTTSETFFSLSAWKNIFTAVATGGVVFAFTGFKHGIELAGESKNPSTTIPWAILGSITICLFLYLGLQIAFIGSITTSSLSNGWEHLIFPGDIGPFAGIAGALGLMWLVKLLMIDAAISPLGAASVYISSTARITYAMSKKNYFPKFLCQLNHNAIPVKAIVFNSIVSLILFLPFPGWQNMVSFLVSILVISYAMGPISLAAINKFSPINQNAFKLGLIKILAFVGFYFCNLIGYWTGWATISKLIIAVGAGILIFVFLNLRNKCKYFSWHSSLWLLAYFFGLTLMSYLGAFGGKNVIPFGWDFLVIGVFSSCIFYIAIQSSHQRSKQNNSEISLANKAYYSEIG